MPVLFSNMPGYFSYFSNCFVKLCCNFWGTVCKMVRLMLSDHCPVCLSCPVCNVGVLWPNGWMDQDETWHGGRPWPRPHCVRWAEVYLCTKWHANPSGHLATTDMGRKLGDCAPFGEGQLGPLLKRGSAPQFLANVCCGQMAGCINMPLGMEMGRGLPLYQVAC